MSACVCMCTCTCMSVCLSVCTIVRSMPCMYVCSHTGRVTNGCPFQPVSPSHAYQQSIAQSVSRSYDLPSLSVYLLSILPLSICRPSVRPSVRLPPCLHTYLSQSNASNASVRPSVKCVMFVMVSVCLSGCPSLID